MELKMEHEKNKDLDAGKKIQSLYLVKHLIIKPVQQMLGDSILSVNDVSTAHISKVWLYLKKSKQQLIDLDKALTNERFINNEIATEAKQTVDQLKKNIVLLENKMKVYKDSIDKENKIDISNLEKYFQDDPDLFETLINDTLQVFDEPNNNSVYGDSIRRTLKDLANFQSVGNLNYRINQCNSFYKKTEEHLVRLSKFNHVQGERDDVIKVQRSFKSLSVLCNLMSKNIQKTED